MFDHLCLERMGSKIKHRRERAGSANGLTWQKQSVRISSCMHCRIMLSRHIILVHRGAGVARFQTRPWSPWPLRSQLIKGVSWAKHGRILLCRHNYLAHRCPYSAQIRISGFARVLWAELNIHARVDFDVEIFKLLCSE